MACPDEEIFIMRENQSKTFTATHRVLHWGIAILMGVLFFTGFLRMQWMSKKAVISAVEQSIQSVELTKEQKLGVAKSLRDPMWDWHERAAYVMFLAIAARLLYMAKKGLRFPSPWDQGLTGKERMQGSLYLLFYFFVFVQSVSGAYLMWVHGSLKGPLETLHKFALYWFPIFFLLHIGGIVLAELGEQKGVTSQMIGGD